MIAVGTNAGIGEATSHPTGSATAEHDGPGSPSVGLAEFEAAFALTERFHDAGSSSPSAPMPQEAPVKITDADVAAFSQTLAASRNSRERQAILKKLAASELLSAQELLFDSLLNTEFSAHSRIEAAVALNAKITPNSELDLKLKDIIGAGKVQSLGDFALSLYYIAWPMIQRFSESNASLAAKAITPIIYAFSTEHRAEACILAALARSKHDNRMQKVIESYAKSENEDISSFAHLALQAMRA